MNAPRPRRRSTRRQCSAASRPAEPTCGACACCKAAQSPSCRRPCRRRSRLLLCSSCASRILLRPSRAPPTAPSSRSPAGRSFASTRWPRARRAATATHAHTFAGERRSTHTCVAWLSAARPCCRAWWWPWAARPAFAYWSAAVGTARALASAAVMTAPSATARAAVAPLPRWRIEPACCTRDERCAAAYLPPYAAPPRLGKTSHRPQAQSPAPTRARAAPPTRCAAAP